jgi:O-methyltransferase
MPADHVKFLEGWIKDTLPVAPIDSLAVLRLDVDMYASTMDSLNNPYSKVSVGGYTIIDDYARYQPANRPSTIFVPRTAS